MQDTKELKGALAEIEDALELLLKDIVWLPNSPTKKVTKQALTLCKQIREAAKTEHKLDAETDQFHTPQWIWNLAYVAEQICDCSSIDEQAMTECNEGLEVKDD